MARKQTVHSHIVDDMLDTVVPIMDAVQLQRYEKDIDKMVDAARDKMHREALRLIGIMEQELTGHKVLKRLKEVIVEGYNKEYKLDVLRDAINVKGYRKTLLTLRNGRHTVKDLEDIHLGRFKFHDDKIKKASRLGGRNASKVKQPIK